MRIVSNVIRTTQIMTEIMACVIIIVMRSAQLLNMWYFQIIFVICKII